MYKLAGTLSIPAGKKDELNRYILQILNKCGIRKTEEMRLDGKTFTVVSLPKPDKDGVVRFDYSIFEKRKRETASYNMNTFELIVPDGGYREFQMAMNIIYVMLESYSETCCYFMRGDKIVNIVGYVELISDLLGIDLQKTPQKKKELSHNKERVMIQFYRVIERKYEDEFIEFWEDDERNFSDDMRDTFSDWKKWFNEVVLSEDVVMEAYLAEIIISLELDWKCCLVDKRFVTEFLCHTNDDNYKKALVLYRKIIDKDSAYFPELTQKQAICWILRNNCNDFNFTVMNAFQALLINHKHRMEILGF